MASSVALRWPLHSRLGDAGFFPWEPSSLPTTPATSRGATSTTIPRRTESVSGDLPPGGLVAADPVAVGVELIRVRAGHLHRPVDVARPVSAAARAIDIRAGRDAGAVARGAAG